MPRVFKNFQSVGFFVPFGEIPCQPVPVYDVKDVRPTNWCMPGIPYDVVAEYVFTEPADANSERVIESLWLGIRPKAQQDILDWVLASDIAGKVNGVYCRFNQIDSTPVEVT